MLYANSIAVEGGADTGDIIQMQPARNNLRSGGKVIWANLF